MRGIEFFIEKEKSHSCKDVFGLCDNNDEKPAYIDEDVANKDSKWIGEVRNASRKEVEFYPVGHCVELLRENKSQAQRCEGILRFDENNIIFTELKNRKIIPSDWLKDAEEQIIETMSFFFENYDLQSFKTKSWVCNNQLTNQNYFQQIADFKEKTKNKFGGRGFVLYISKSIEV